MANVDDRVMEALLRLSRGTWSYGSPENRSLLAGQRCCTLHYVLAWLTVRAQTFPAN